MLELLIKFFFVWISFDIIILATTWYLATTVRPLYPDWWRRVIVDDDPLYEASPYRVQVAPAVVDYAAGTYRGAKSRVYHPTSHRFK